MTEIENAIISAAIIDDADHGLLSATLMLDFGGSTQGFGGHCLYSPSKPLSEQLNYAGLFLWRVMEIAGVTRWSDLQGKTIRVKRDGGYMGKLTEIGHIVKNDWFNPTEEFK